MKKIYSFLFFPISFLMVLITLLINHAINPTNEWYINLPLVLVMMGFLGCSMYLFFKETERVEKQKVWLIILVPFLFSLPLSFLANPSSLMLDNRVFISNYFLELGSIYAMIAFSLSIKKVLGSGSVYLKFIGIGLIVLTSIGAISNCFHPTITVGR